MNLLSRFTVRDTSGGSYLIEEYGEPGTSAAAHQYKTADGKKAELLDAVNFIIHSRNPKTGESRIEAHR